MAWRKAPDSLIEAFDASLPDDPRIERRKMFGYPAAFTAGHLFAGLHQEDLILRLPEDDRADATRSIGARPFEPMPGRTMREYVALNGAERLPPELLRTWLRRAFENARNLPPKKPRKAAPRAKSKAGPR